MHPGRWFNETAFDSLDYLVPALLLFVLAAAKWAWRYWHRESLRARRIVLSLLTIGAGCLLLWVVLGRRPWWLPLVGLALGPVAVLLRIQKVEKVQPHPFTAMVSRILRTCQPRAVKGCGCTFSTFWIRS